MFFHFLYIINFEISLKYDQTYVIQIQMLRAFDPQSPAIFMKYRFDLRFVLRVIRWKGHDPFPVLTGKIIQHIYNYMYI